MDTTLSNIDLSTASSRAIQIRKLYHQLEIQHHGTTWSKQEDMIGLMSDIGELGRLLMASDDRWAYKGDVPKDIADKISECMWWLFVLSDRLEVDISSAFSSKMNELHFDLSASVEKALSSNLPQ